MTKIPMINKRFINSIFLCSPKNKNLIRRLFASVRREEYQNEKAALERPFRLEENAERSSYRPANTKSN